MFYIEGSNYWTKITLEICRHEEDFTKFFGTVCIRNVPLLFKIKFLRPIETMNFKEGLKETEIRRILFSIEVANLHGKGIFLDTKEKYDFFYNLLVSYAVKLHFLIENKKIFDRSPDINMTTINWPGIQIPTRSDIFTYMVKTSEVPKFLKKKFIKISTS